MCSFYSAHEYKLTSHMRTVHKNTAPKNGRQYKIGFKTFLLLNANVTTFFNEEAIVLVSPPVL